MATNIMQKLCAYLIFVYCCNAFGSMNGNSIVLPSHSHPNPHHHQHQHQHQHQHNNRHLHLNAHHSDESRFQLQLLHHNNSDVPTKKRINFYYSSLSRTPNTNPYNRMNENNNNHNIANESNVHNTIRSNAIANQTLQSRSHDEPASNSNAKFSQRNTTTISTKTSLNSLKLTLIQTNGNYPHFNRWPIATPQTTNTEQSYRFHGNDYGFKWKPANDQFVPSFKPTFESIPNPIGKTTTPTPNDFHTRDHRFHSKNHRGYVMWCWFLFWFLFFHDNRLVILRGCNVTIASIVLIVNLVFFLLPKIIFLTRCHWPWTMTAAILKIKCSLNQQRQVTVISKKINPPPALIFILICFDPILFCRTFKAQRTIDKPNQTIKFYFIPTVLELFLTVCSPQFER